MMINDLTQDAKWVSRITVSEHISQDKEWWAYAKRRLMSEFMENVMPDMIGDGLHHVMKFDYLVRDIPMGYGMKEYLMTCKHSVANVQRVIFAEIGAPSYAAVGGARYKVACRYCGNTLILDKRGACSACGGPAGGEK
jgi:ribosomal protein L37E